MENNRYNNTKVYKMYDLLYGYFYIGSTTDKLSRRFSKHKNDSKKVDTKAYKHFNSVGWENVKMVLMEEHYLENRDQQMREENRVIEMYLDDEKCLNSVRPWFSPSEKEVKLEKKKVRVQTYKKQYYEQNIEKTKEYNANYHAKYKHYYNGLKKEILQCPCGYEIAVNHKARHEKTETSSMVTRSTTNS